MLIKVRLYQYQSHEEHHLCMRNTLMLTKIPQISSTLIMHSFRTHQGLNKMKIKIQFNKKFLSILRRLLIQECRSKIVEIAIRICEICCNSSWGQKWPEGLLVEIELIQAVVLKIRCPSLLPP